MFYRWENAQYQDYDQISTLTPAFPQIEDHGFLSFYQVSQEMRIASPKGHFIDYQAGLYFLKAVDTEYYVRNISQLTGTNVISNSGTSFFGTDANNFSGFGEANVNFTDSFRAIIGARLIRDGVVSWEGNIASLRRFKDDATEVRDGYECGIGLGSFNDIKIDDVIETFELREKPRV